MDGLSAVAGVAIAGVQLSKALYDLYSTVRTSHQEIQDVANNVSLLAMVLEELDGVLRDDELNYRPQLREAAQSIALRCASVFKDIRKHTGTDRGLKGEKFYEKIAWYFKRERVKPLRSSLECLKSTLNILLHIVQLAKITKGVEEYPGVKSIGQWYVRRERRGLVCLVIDNRHAVENLKRLEKQKTQTNKDTIENEQPLAFADIFPFSTPNHKRGQSPERKFVVTFRNPSRRMGDGFQPSQEPDISLLQVDSSTPDDNKPPPSSPFRRSRSPLDLSTDPNAETVGRSTLSQSTRRSRTRGRPTDEQPTFRLILDIIPHEEADGTFKSAQYTSGSALLEAKADKTIDTLMRCWTHVDPKYFSEDDRSSISSTEPSLPLLRNRNPHHSHDGESLDPAETVSSPDEGSRRQKSGLLENSSPAKKFGKIQSVSLEKGPDTSSSLPAGQDRSTEKRPRPLSLTPQNVQGGAEAKSRSPSHISNDREHQSPKEPSTPAPPYPTTHSDQCSSRPSVSTGAPSHNTDNRPLNVAQVPLGDTKTENEVDTSIDGAMRLFETKLLEIMKRMPLQSSTLDAQSRQITEQRENRQQLVTFEQEAEPVILKDCLGRRFLFPIQKCRSWQNMENLIKRSFCHVEPINSKIFRGSYDILSPTGEIILPEIWDSVIKPGWVVELRFWDFSITGETSLKDTDVGVVEMAPVVKPGHTPSNNAHLEVSSDTTLTTTKRRTSVRTWLGSRKSSPSVALE